MGGQTRIDQVDKLQAYLDRATADSWDTLPMSPSTGIAIIRTDKSQIFDRFDLETEGIDLDIRLDYQTYGVGIGSVIFIPIISNADNTVTIDADINILSGEYIQGVAGDINTLVIIITSGAGDNMGFWINQKPKHQITMSTNDASGGRDGDIHFKYTE